MQLRSLLPPLLALSSCMTGRLAAQISPMEMIPKDVTPVERPILFNEIGLRSLDGIHRDGRLVGTAGDSLVYLAERKQSRIDLDLLARVGITEEKNMNVEATYGAVLGVYLLNVLFDRFDPNGVGWIRGDDVYGFAGMNLLYLLAAAGAGYIAGSGRDRPVVEFTLDGTPEERAIESRRLRQYLSGGRMTRRWHLSAAGSPIHTDRTDVLDEEMKAEGWLSERDFRSEPASPSDLLSELRLGWSLDERIELGAALEFLGEPPLSVLRNRIALRQTLDGNGFYLLGRYSLPLTRSGWVSFNVSGGVGGYAYEWTRALRREQQNGGLTRDTVDGFVPAGLLSTGIDIYLQQGLSIGVFTDYQIISSRSSPAVEDAGLAAMTYIGSRWNAGFTVGVHL